MVALVLKTFTVMANCDDLCFLVLITFISYVYTSVSNEDWWTDSLAKDFEGTLLTLLLFILLR